MSLQDGKATSIVEALESYLTQKLLSLNQVSSFGSDGAAVMIGRHAGVSTLLKRQNICLLSVHCICHWLALAASQAAAEIIHVKKSEEIPTTFYSNSAVRSSEIQSLLRDSVLKAKDVRWLSHARAVPTIQCSFKSILVSRDYEASERSDPTALGLATLMKKYEFVAALEMIMPMVESTIALVERQLAECWKQELRASDLQ